MAHPLDGAHAKIRRARKHLEDLDQEVRLFTDTQPYSFVAEFDEKRSANVLRVQRQNSEQLSPDVPLIVGDAIHCLRSSLDHLVYQLAETIGTGAGKWTAFPVFNDPKDFGGQSPRLLEGVGKAHRTVIERLQPYHAVYRIEDRKAERRFLPNFVIQMTNRLDNWDKHRLLLPSAAVAPNIVPTIRGLRDYKIEPAPGWVRMEEGAVLFTIYGGVLTGALEDVKVEPDPPYTVVFGNPDPDPFRLWSDRWTGAVSKNDLDNFASAIEVVIRTFEGEFPP